jgi:hypothetical protein
VITRRSLLASIGLAGIAPAVSALVKDKAKGGPTSIEFRRAIDRFHAAHNKLMEQKRGRSRNGDAGSCRPTFLFRNTCCVPVSSGSLAGEGVRLLGIFPVR